LGAQAITIQDVRGQASSQTSAGEWSPAPANELPGGQSTSPQAAADGPRPEILFRRRVRLIPAIRELWAFRELVVTIAERDLRVRYKQAVLGIAWAVISPLAFMIAFTIIFTKFAHVNTHGAPYALFSYLGLLPWTFFSAAVSTGGLSLTANVPLLNKLYCPREVFPLAAIADATVDLLIASFVLLILFPITGYGPHGQMYFVPLLLLIMFTFTIGVTLAFASVVVFMRDLRLVLPMVLQLGLFVTPVVYAATSIVHTKTLLLVYSIINPLVPVIDDMRRIVLYGQGPDWPPLIAGGASSLLFLLAGFMLFKRLETRMADVA
jgi:ABC-type polysaccharide/polyol phosphate export permease